MELLIKKFKNINETERFVNSNKTLVSRYFPDLNNFISNEGRRINRSGIIIIYENETYTIHMEQKDLLNISILIATTIRDEDYVEIAVNTLEERDAVFYLFGSYFRQSNPVDIPENLLEPFLHMYNLYGMMYLTFIPHLTRSELHQRFNTYSFGNLEKQLYIPISLIAAGYDTSVAVLGKNRLLIWGRNTSLTRIPQILSSKEIKQILVLKKYIAVLTTDGTIIDWGENKKYRRYTDLKFKMIAANSESIIGIKPNGNAVGLIGKFPVDIKYLLISARGKYEILLGENNILYTSDGYELNKYRVNKPVRQVLAGDGYFVVLYQNGELTVYGNDKYDPPKNLGTVIQITNGKHYIAALTSNGRVHVWGEKVSHLQDVRTSSNIVSIASGNKYIIGLTSTQKIIMWGQSKHDHKIPAELA